MFRWREREVGTGALYGVEWAVTDRHGGSSTGEHAGLNLGAHVGDDPTAVESNRERVAAALGMGAADLRFMAQVHGCAVVEAGDADPPQGDGLVTDRTDVALCVLVADCTPVLLVDRVVGLAGVAHAGRPGMTQGVVPATVHRLRDRGAADLEAVVGPSICARCYEVPEQLRADAAQASPAAYGVSWAGTPAVDVAAGVVDQLTRLGVPVRWLPGCSRESEDLYSYRRDGRAGRYAGIVRLLPPEHRR